MAPIQSTPQQPQQHSQFFKLFQSIGVAAIAAVITVTFIHPIDVVKTRLQISGEAGRGGQQYNGVISTVAMLYKEKGLGTFYKGIQAAYMRELSYTSLRLGLYTPIKDLLSGENKDKPSALVKFNAGALSGAIAATAGNPFDLLKTRMMAKVGTNLGFGEAFNEIYSKWGIKGFYKGLSANVSRGVVLNATKLGTYDVIKVQLKEKLGFQGIGLHFMSAFCAGFFMTLTVTPFDMCRTRLMNQPSDKIIYTGLVDAFTKIYTQEGFTALYKGFYPVWGRFAPTTVLQLVILEQLRKFFGMKGI